MDRVGAKITRNRLGMYVALAGTILAACALVLATNLTPAEAAFPGANGRIAFAKENTQDCTNTIPRHCSYEIFTINPDGSGQKRLTNNDWADTQPAWSPNGRKIAWLAYRGGYGLFTMNANGDNPTRLTNAKDSYPTWSPDGKKIAFARNDDLYIVNADGSGQATQLTTDPAEDTFPDWSPNGVKIAFMRGDGSTGEIYTINAASPESATNQPIQLTDKAGKANTAPSWSPNGAKIAFDSNRDGDFDVYKMDADGTNAVRLTGSTAMDGNPAYSPSGTKIAFESKRNGRSEIYKMDANGGTDETRLTQNNLQDVVPDWQPLP
jgi:Tol biopolymer transport system component